MNLVITIPYELARNVLRDLKQNIEDIGGCDHSVGICCCDQIRTVEEFAEVIRCEK